MDETTREGAARARTGWIGAAARAAAGASALGGLLAAGACGPPDAAPGTVAFTNVSVLPMQGPDVLENQTVVVVGDRIVEVGAAGEVVVGRGATVIEGEGRYLMPGLAEMHAHVPPVPDPPREQLEDILFLYLANGVTTIRGMLGQAYQIELAREIERGDVLGPTFYVGAPSINGTSAPDPESAKRLIREHAAAGYHLQKIHPGVSLETWDRMIEVAAEVGLTFGGHVPVDVGLVHALETGMSTVDHLDGFVKAVAEGEVESQVNSGRPIDVERLARDPSSYDRQIDQVVELALERDAYVVPTLYLWENLYGTTDPEPFLELPEMRYVSAEQKEAWRRQGSRGPQGSPEALAAFFSLRDRILKRLADEGAGVLMGTDSPQMFNVPGFALHRELVEMEEAGLTRRQILESGTVAVARYVGEHLGLDARFGAIAPGNRADLVLLGSNPLDGLDNLTDRVGVMARGRWLSRADIGDGLARIAAKHGG